MTRPIALLTVLLLCITAFAPARAEEDPTVEEIKALILASYINGAFNELDADAMRKGFHPDFAIFSAKGDELARYPIATWADGVAKRKSDPNFDPQKNVWDHTFVEVDVTGGAAFAKIDLYHDGKLVYTDYLSLLKFDSGWRIAAKVYHKHE